LLKAFSSHHAISDINIYAPYINRNVHDVYIEDNTLHATIKAGTEENLSFKELKEIVDLIDSTIHYCFPDDYEEISKKLDVKLNIHCPGIIEFIMAGSFFLFTFSIALMQINHFINGGEIKADFSVDLIKQSASASFSSSSKGIRGRNIEEKGLDQRHELSLKAQELAKTTNLQLPSFELNPEVEEPVDEEVNE